ncbi:uncharacterized protein LOC142793523 isoform X3 [Rhipicephalus microplus]|uniref:uncharacterized protein LOC142793523 isoform X3 n=1 Tax=Rhipicephalus microplus TaxID=6941 RepID=UPI003F6DA193
MCSPIFLYLGSILLHNVAYARSAPPRKNTKDYFCSDNLKCNFGEKQTCLFKDTSTPTLKCVQHQSDCVTLWKGTCGNNGVPKCLDDHTECICFCGEAESSLLEKLKKKFGALTDKFSKSKP